MTALFRAVPTETTFLFLPNKIFQHVESILYFG
jgi:hypothetical protein